jgi:hypothetical protein
MGQSRDMAGHTHWRSVPGHSRQTLDLACCCWLSPNTLSTTSPRCSARRALQTPETGIRPINITDSWRRIAAKALLTTGLSNFNRLFQQGHQRVFQFSRATLDGAASMYHIINAILKSTSKLVAINTHSRVVKATTTFSGKNAQQQSQIHRRGQGGIFCGYILQRTMVP